MFKRAKFKHTHPAVSIIEVVIDMAILSLISVIVILAMISSVKTVTESSEMATAGQLANEKLETLRNLSYDDLATQDGPIVPQGDILDYENVSRGNFKFIVHTDIRYVDDAYDSLIGSGDLNPADYKKITVTVMNLDHKSLSTISTDIASRAAETASNTGVLRVSVLDASGSPVPEAEVTITNSAVSPAIDVTTTTDANGIIFVPNLTPSTHYHVVTTKTGYNTDYTSPITVSNPNPTNPDATILLQQPTTITLAIDKLSTLTINFSGIFSSGDSAKLAGQKTIGQNPEVLKTLTSFSLASEVILDDVEFDSYNLTLPSGFWVKTCDPYLPIVIEPNSNTTLDCELTNDSSDVRVLSISPIKSTTSASVSLEIIGANFSDAKFYLQKNGDAEITFDLGLTVSADQTTLSGTVDFSGLVTGTYNLIYRDSLGHVATQKNAITIE